MIGIRILKKFYFEIIVLSGGNVCIPQSNVNLEVLPFEFLVGKIYSNFRLNRDYSMQQLIDLELMI